jgi:predicted nucleic acid-binding protein
MTIAAAALRLAAEENHKVYDMMYVALAQYEGCDLITADQKLVNKLSARFPFVRWIGDFPI